MNRLAKELVRIARSLTAETSKETIDRLIDSFDGTDFIKSFHALENEIRQTPIEVLQELFEDVKKRPHEKWGKGFYIEEVYNMIKDELTRRENTSNWDNRDTTSEKEVELNGGIKVILTEYKMGEGKYRNDKWSIRTPDIGLIISTGKTPREAIENANKMIDKHGVEKVKRTMDDQDFRHWNK